MRQNPVRAIAALLPLFAAVANGGAAYAPDAATFVECRAAHSSLAPRPDAHGPAVLAPAAPAPEVAPKENGANAPPVRRAVRAAARYDVGGVPAAARARAACIAYLEFRDSLARAWLGSFFGSTAPPPSLS